MIKNVHKTILAFATLVLCLCAFTAQAQFTGEGYYRIKNKSEDTYYLNSEDGQQTLIADLNATGLATVFKIEENATYTGKYTIYTHDKVRYVNAVNGSSLLTRTTANNSINDDIAVWDIISQDATSYSVGISYDIVDDPDLGVINQYLKKSISTASSNPNKLGMGDGFGNALNKWIFEPVAGSFLGPGQYRIKNEDKGNYIKHVIGDLGINTTSDNSDEETIFNIEENATDASKYSITTSDGLRFLVVKLNTNGTYSVITRTITSNDINVTGAKFDIQRESVDTYAIGAAYTPDQFLRENGSLDVNLAEAISADDRWEFEYVATLSSKEINTQKALKAYPNPSSDGIFTLDEASEWSVYSITGALISNGNGTKIDISSAPKGMYILRSNGIATKLVIQ